MTLFGDSHINKIPVYWTSNFLAQMIYKTRQQNNIGAKPKTFCHHRSCYIWRGLLICYIGAALPRECLPDHNCRFFNNWPRLPIADLNQRFFAEAVKHNQKETRSKSVTTKVLLFCDFYTKVNPPCSIRNLSTYVSLLQFISTYHHCMYYVIFRLLMHLFKIIPFDWASTTSMWFCFYFNRVRKYLFCYFIL